MAEYMVTINDFEGPLDLLLHLIKQSKMEITDIKISDITEQYLDYIEAMEQMNLDIASEYLIMASELIEIKSHMLLPNTKIEEDDYEEDPRENLINRLLEYEKYKKMTNTFRKLEETRNKIHTKIPEDMKKYSSDDSLISEGELSVDILTDAFKKFLCRKEKEKPLNTKVTKKEYSVTKRSHEIRNILKRRKKIDFDELFDIYTKDYVVVTFLSILDMTRKHEININQENNFNKISIMIRE